MSKMLLQRSLLYRIVLACVVAVATLLPAAAAVADNDVERTLAIIELRAGPEADPLTAKYLKGVIEALKREKPADLLVVDGKEGADVVRKDRNQVPTALSDDRRAQLAEARKKGVDLLDNADFQGAIKALTAAEAKYGAAVAAPGADDKLRGQYLDVLVQLATAYVVAGDKNAAGETFRTVINTFGLKAKVTDDNYRPDVVEMFKAEVKKIDKSAKGAIEVTSTPAGARIILAGNDRGAAPMTVSDLIPGRYDLRLQAGNASSLLRRVKIDAGGTTKVAIDVEYETHLVIEDDHVGLAYPDLATAEARLQSDAIGVGRDIRTDLVCAIGIFDGKLASFLVDVAGKKIVRSVKEVKVPAAALSDKAISRALVTILGEKASADVKVKADGVVGSSGGGGGRKWHQSTPGWIAAGAAVVALGVGAAFSGNLASVDAYYCADPSKSCDGYNTTANQATYASAVEDFKSSYKSKQLISGIGLGAGAVLAGVAGFLFWQETTKDASAQLMVPRTDGSQFAARVALPPLSLGAAPQRFVAQ